MDNSTLNVFCVFFPFVRFNGLYGDDTFCNDLAQIKFPILNGKHSMLRPGSYRALFKEVDSVFKLTFDFILFILWIALYQVTSM